MELIRSLDSKTAFSLFLAASFAQACTSREPAPFGEQEQVADPVNPPPAAEMIDSQTPPEIPPVQMTPVEPAPLSFATNDGGYYTAGPWMGYTWAITTDGGTIEPADFSGLVTGEPLCAAGALAESWEDTGQIGLNLNQEPGEGTTSLPFQPIGESVWINASSNTDATLRVQLNGPSSAWCIDLPATGGVSLKWSDFNETCWDGAGEYYAGEPLTQLSLLVPGNEGFAVDFDICLLEAWPEEDPNAVVQPPAEVVADFSDPEAFDPDAVPDNGDRHFKVDQFGYRPSTSKVAVISQSQEGLFAPDTFEPAETLEVRSLPDETVVFSGPVVAWNEGATDRINGDKGWWFDFSEITTPGEYIIWDEKNQVSSYVFEIGDNVYRNALVHGMRTFYYQREAFAKAPPFADPRWADTESHLNDLVARDVFDKENAATERDVSGGWMDAGDYNKYITFLDGVIPILLASYQENPSAWGDDHNIPESGNGVPDLLDEIEFEIQWMQKMQDSDGGVFIKSGDADYFTASPPSTHDYPRYYGMKCSSSTISLAGIFAQTALVFQNFPELEERASQMETSALAAWNWYNENDRSEDCDNGEIKAGDADKTLEEQDAQAARAAIYLYALTGEESFHEYFKEKQDDLPQLGSGWWGPYGQPDEDALLFYTQLPSADVTIVDAIKASKTAGANDEFYGWASDDHLYRAVMQNSAFHWGHNNVRATTGNINMNMVHYQLDDAGADAYKVRAQELLHWFHGVNALGKMMLSNMYDLGGDHCVNEFYHSWFKSDTQWHSVLSGDGPAPGYIVGGPNKDYSGLSNPPLGQPFEKTYVDSIDIDLPWEISENAIYYQAAYLRLVAHFALMQTN